MNTYTNEQVAHTKNSAGFLAGVFWGGVIGAVTALFLAPQSGKDTRQQIQQKALNLRTQATNTVESTLDQLNTKASQLKLDMEQKTKDLSQQGKEVLITQLDRVAEAVESSKKLLQGNGKTSNSS
jgi:gas vesicle protein